MLNEAIDLNFKTHVSKERNALLVTTLNIYFCFSLGGLHFHNSGDAAISPPIDYHKLSGIYERWASLLVYFYFYLLFSIE